MPFGEANTFNMFMNTMHFDFFVRVFVVYRQYLRNVP